MSTRHYSWAWAQPVPSSAKLVLLYLVERADKAGMCWPSIAMTAEATGLGFSTVQRALAVLQETGVISRRRRHRRADGTRTSDEITLRLEVTMTSSQQVTVTGPTGHGDRATTGHGDLADPPSNPSSNPSNGRLKKYPQHKHEQNAERALATLITDRSLPLPLDELMSHAYRLGNGDPWDGYLEVKVLTELQLDTARDPAAAVRARLKHAAVA